MKAFVFSLSIILYSIKINAQDFAYSITPGNTAFAIDFYKECSAQSPKNVFISPFSISSALAMTYPGARAKTAEEMKLALGFIQNLKTQNNEYSSLIRNLSGRESPFKIANTLWTMTGYRYEPKFIEINDIYFDATFKEVNFKNFDETRKEINTSIEDQTQGKIKDLLPPGSITELTRLVLTNAVYFKDSWLVPFKKEKTKNADFFSEPGKPVKAMFMENAGKFYGFENESVSILELPYLSGDFSMVILLPKVDLKEFEEQILTADNYFNWSLVRTPFTKIMVPRFKIEQTTAPVPILQKFGMVEAFNENKADFSGISTQQQLFISGIYHKAFVDVNEEGTEAAAATGVVAEARSAEFLAPPRDFIANRPFIFIIRDVTSKTILFIGKLADPNASN
ncbi:MAG: serpin family protein [Bacteroidota bacterium]